MGSPCAALVLCVAAAGCGTSSSPVADAGPTFTADLTSGKYGEPLPSVTAEERASFLDGKDAFRKQESVGSGLGPVFNQPVCTQCHDSPPAIGGTNQRLETRYGRRLPDGGFDRLTEKGGTLLHDHGIGPVQGFSFAAEVVPPEANVVAPRRTQPVFGLGLVDATPDQVFLALAEAQAREAPEAAGRAAMVTDLGDRAAGGGPLRVEGERAHPPPVLGGRRAQRDGHHQPAVPGRGLPPGRLLVARLQPRPHAQRPGGGGHRALHRLHALHRAASRAGAVRPGAAGQRGVRHRRLRRLSRPDADHRPELQHRAGPGGVPPLLGLPAARHGCAGGRHRPGRRPRRGDAHPAPVGSLVPVSPPPRRPRGDAARGHRRARRAGGGRTRPLRRAGRGGPGGPARRSSPRSDQRVPSSSRISRRASASSGKGRPSCSAPRSAESASSGFPSSLFARPR